MKKFALVLGMLSMSLVLVADVETINGTTWFFQPVDGGVEIVNAYANEAAVTPKPTGVLSVPSILGGRTVVGIGPYAFCECNSLTRVMIPSSVTRIGEYAFYGCRGLDDLILPGFVSSIGSYAFYGCRGLDEVTLPGSVESLGDFAFSDCGDLQRVTFQSGIKSIGGSAFYGNHGISEVTIPSTVELIGVSAFGDCVSLKRLVIQPGAQSGMATIGDSAFYGCSSLTDVAIPGSVGVIGALAFGNCSALDSVSIAPGVSEVGASAFSGCDDLKSVSIPSSVLNIGAEAFYGCQSMKSALIEAGVQTIGDGAFSGCSGLTSVRVPSSVTFLGLGAFSSCSSLAVAVVPRALEEMVVVNAVFDSSSPSIIYTDETEGSPTGSGGGSGVLSPGSGSSGSGSGSSGSGSSSTVSMFTKAQTVSGAMYGQDGSVTGVVQIKVGKANSKGVVRVSGAATLMDGKKVSAKSVAMSVSDAGTVSDTLSFRAPIGDVAFAMTKDGAFTFANGAYSAKKADVGGTLSADQLVFDVAMGALPDFGEGWQVISAAFPNAVKIAVASGKKWTLPAVSVLKYQKNRETGKYELVGLGDVNKPNVSSLKLSYSSSTGRFKGSFKLYATNKSVTPEGKSPKLKKTTLNVSGFMVDGVGVGEATCKNPALGPWAVSVK